MGNTAEVQVKYDELKGYIAEMMKKPGPLMPIMQKAQDIFGSLQMCIRDRGNTMPLFVVSSASTDLMTTLSPKGLIVISHASCNCLLYTSCTYPIFMPAKSSVIDP